MTNRKPICFEVIEDFHVDILYCLGLVKLYHRTLRENNNKLIVSITKFEVSALSETPKADLYLS